MGDKTYRYSLIAAAGSMVIASIRVAVHVSSIKEFVTDWFITMISVLYTGLTSGGAYIIGICIFATLKKNLNYERKDNRGYRCFYC